MADKTGDKGTNSRKEARREAKIEAKRRKLAEQRAARRAAQDESNKLKASTGESPGESLRREVTSDSSNTEMRIKLDKIREMSEPAETDTSEDGQPAGNPAEEQDNQTSDKPESPEDAKPDRQTPAEDGSQSRSAEQADVPAVMAAGNRIRSLKESLTSMRSVSPSAVKERFAFIRNIRVSRAVLIRCIIILLLLIGVIHGISVINDYYNKKPEMIVTDEGYKHYYKFENCVVLNGIDISEHHEGEINWDKVKSSGIDFVFVRAGYRAVDDGSLHADDSFAANLENAQKAGLMTGVYFYSQALNADEGREEAGFVLDLVKDYDLTMPIVIDYEIYKDGRLDKRIQAGEMYAASFYHDAVLGFTETVEAAGYESAVYASKDMLTNYMQADLIDDMAVIWLAKYDTDPDLDADYWFWQYSETGKAGGIQGDVDQNFWYMEPEKVYETRAKHSKSAVSVGDCKIVFRRDTTRLRNFRAEPKFALTYEGREMKEGRDYVSSVVHNTQTGTGYVIIRGIGKYKDWIMHPFVIE